MNLANEKIELLSQKAELRRLIRRIGHFIKASPEECDEMFEETLKNHLLQEAIDSFKKTLSFYLQSP